MPPPPFDIRPGRSSPAWRCVLHVHHVGGPHPSRPHTAGRSWERPGGRFWSPPEGVRLYCCVISASSSLKGHTAVPAPEAQRPESLPLLCLDVAPAFTRLPANTTVTDGATAVLRCEVSGAPKPAITWTRGGRRASTAGRGCFTLPLSSPRPREDAAARGAPAGRCPEVGRGTAGAAPAASRADGPVISAQTLEV